jgi:hypothetical protein
MPKQVRIADNRSLTSFPKFIEKLSCKPTPFGESIPAFVSGPAANVLQCWCPDRSCSGRMVQRFENVASTEKEDHPARSATSELQTEDAV